MNISQARVLFPVGCTVITDGIVSRKIVVQGHCVSGIDGTVWLTTNTMPDVSVKAESAKLIAFCGFKIGDFVRRKSGESKTSWREKDIAEVIGFDFEGGVYLVVDDTNNQLRNMSTVEVVEDSQSGYKGFQIGDFVKRSDKFMNENPGVKQVVTQVKGFIKDGGYLDTTDGFRLVDTMVLVDEECLNEPLLAEDYSNPEVSSKAAMDFDCEIKRTPYAHPKSVPDAYESLCNALIWYNALASQYDDAPQFKLVTK